MDINSFGALLTQASGYNQLAPCAADAYNYEFGSLVIYCPDVPASQCVSTICADSASNWLAGMSAEASMIDCQSTNAASASVVFSNLCDANGVVIAGTTNEGGCVRLCDWYWAGSCADGILYSGFAVDE